MRIALSLKYLHKRGGVWWYNRRIPARVAHLDTRERIRISLDTYSEDQATLLRDQLAIADEAYWGALLADEFSEEKDIQNAAAKRYRLAVSRALAAGFEYRPVSVLVEDEPLEEALERLLAVRDRSGVDDIPKAPDAEALLGGVEEPKTTVSQALEIYFDEIALNEQMYKSDHQRYQWRKVKKRAISYFIEQEGDIAMVDITRDHALRYKKYWAGRIQPTDPDVDAITANTANRNFGNIRALYREYFKHIGEDTRPNPFSKINFAAKSKTEVPPFDPDWIEKKILKPGILSGIKPELQLITLLLIETGCRPSEIINLQPTDFCMDAEIPYLKIKARTHGKKKRELKTAASEREIPLVGVSLEAARRAAKHAFPHYQDRNELFSANLMKAFRVRKLFPTEAHKIYSFRHSFEKRMQEANIDYGLRCLLMGHSTDRPAYGDGGSMAYRKDELEKISLPFDSAIFETFDGEHAEWGPVN